MRFWKFGESWSFRCTVLFWWTLFLVIQQVERLFLLPEAMTLEQPTAELLAKTLLTGLRADLIVATIGVVLGLLSAILFWVAGLALSQRRDRTVGARLYRRGFTIASLVLGMVILVFLTVDMGYFGYNRHHLDPVFFEYVDDLVSQRQGHANASEAGMLSSQAFKQTEAELQEAKKWAMRVIAFLFFQYAAIMLWGHFFRRSVQPAVSRSESRSPRKATVVLALGLMVGASGLDPQGPWSIARVPITDSTYYLLAQNPLWYGGDVFLGSLAFKLSGAERRVRNLMPWEEALWVARKALAPDASFPNPEYPFVREAEPQPVVRFDRSPNVLVVFIEGLDRRFLGQTVVPGGSAGQESSMIPGISAARSRRVVPLNVRGGIRLTPFLDQLQEESVFFANFFSNGQHTHHGLFASFCSYYQGYGRAAIKARYTYDYLCLPALLNKGGYQTEMVIGNNRDYHQDHTALFMGRNGLQRFLDESDFPPDAERLGLGMTDGALFEFLRYRIQSLRTSGRPFFLSTLTFSTHHPYKVPQGHPDLRALQGEPDRYLVSLRYLDLEFERFFRGLQRDGLLENTVVFILGDHGRHESVGQTDQERWVSHYTVPLFIWMNQSLRTPSTYRPRTVTTVASQVDLTPTILALTGLSPRVSPFLGRDLSCLLVGDCLRNNFAVLSSQDRIALADRHGLLWYSIRNETLQETDLGVETPAVNRAVSDPAIASRYRTLVALFVSATIMLEENRIWSWKDLGAKL